jgi:hypothetical protein
MTTMGFHQCRSDPCLFVKTAGGLQLCVVHVDDGLLATTTKEQGEQFIAKLRESFRLTDLGEPKKFLGIIVERNENRIKLHQEVSINELLKEHGLQDANSARTPAVSGEYLTSDDSPVSKMEKDRMSRLPYRKLVGSELYISNATHPEISKAVGECARFLANPGENHWTATKRIARFLKWAANKGIICKAQEQVGEELKLECYADKHHGGDTETRKSQTGWVFFFVPQLQA